MLALQMWNREAMQSVYEKSWYTYFDLNVHAVLKLISSKKQQAADVAASDRCEATLMTSDVMRNKDLLI